MESLVFRISGQRPAYWLCFFKFLFLILTLSAESGTLNDSKLALFFQTIPIATKPLRHKRAKEQKVKKLKRQNSIFFIFHSQSTQYHRLNANIISYILYEIKPKKSSEFQKNLHDSQLAARVLRSGSIHL